MQNGKEFFFAVFPVLREEFLVFDSVFKNFH